MSTHFLSKQGERRPAWIDQMRERQVRRAQAWVRNEWARMELDAMRRRQDFSNVRFI